MADNGDVVILRSAVATAPNNVPITGAEHFVPLAIQALFDGSGAGGTFLPVIEIVGPSGDVISRTLARPVAAGSSAEVTFRPFLSDTGDGVRFDTDPQSGDFLSITTTGTDPLSGNGFDLVAAKTVNIQTGQEFDVTTGSFESHTVAGDFRVQADGTIDLVSNGNNVQLGGYAIEVTGDGAAGHITIGLTSGGGPHPQVTLQGDDFAVHLLGATNTLTVYDHLGAAIFRVNEDGSLQGKTGKALTFNL